MIYLQVSIFFINNELHKDLPANVDSRHHWQPTPPSPFEFQNANKQLAKKRPVQAATTGVQASGSGNHARPLGRQFQTATGSVHAPGNTAAGPSSMPDFDPNRPNIGSDPVHIPPAKVVRHPGFGAGLKDPKEGP